MEHLRNSRTKLPVENASCSEPTRYLFLFNGSLKAAGLSVYLFCFVPFCGIDLAELVTHLSGEVCSATSIFFIESRFLFFSQLSPIFFYFKNNVSYQCFDKRFDIIYIYKFI